MTPTMLRAYQRRALSSLFGETEEGGVFTTEAYQYAFETILQADVDGKLQPLPVKHIVRQLSAIETVVRLGQETWYTTDSRA